MLAANSRASAKRDEGELAQAYAQAEARRVIDRGRKHRQSQKLKVAASGFELAGSPIAMLDEIGREAEAEANMIRVKGEAQNIIARGQAAAIKAAGFNAMVEGIGKAANSVLNYSQMKSKIDKNAADKLKLGQSTSRGDMFSSTIGLPNMKVGSPTGSVR